MPAMLTEIRMETSTIGSLGAHGRSEQISDRFLSDEIRQNQISEPSYPQSLWRLRHS
jgi:hypothetical protein